jgi:SAM-dependent methyltransferase
MVRCLQVSGWAFSRDAARDSHKEERVTEYVDYAEYYDLDHRRQVDDVPFYLAYAGPASVAGGSAILELACGTGRILIPLAEAGHEMVGLDLSEKMLALCREKVAERGLGERVHSRTLLLTTRYTFRYEQQVLLERVGFELADVFRDDDRTPYDGTGEIIAVARRPA